MLRLYGSLCVLLLLCVALLPARACPPVTRIVQTSPVVAVKEAVVIKEVIRELPVATFVPLAVAVPAYGVGYPSPPLAPSPIVGTPHSPSQTPPRGGDCEQTVRALEQRLLELERRLAAPAQAPQNAAAPGGQKGLTAQSIFLARCASCHGQNTFADKGGGLKLMEATGGIAPLTDRQMRKLIGQIYSGKMPKNGDPLTDAEVAAVVSWVETQK